MYRIGELNQRIKIERDTPVGDGMGGQDKAPHVLLTLWAKVRNKSVRELLASQQIAAVATVVFVIRWRNDLKPSDRIIWKGIRYNIVGPLDSNNRQPFMEIEAVRGVA
jgi:SPP1 family predicted phage head-tail adaptor